MKMILTSLCLSGRVLMKTLVLILSLSVCYLTSLAQVSFGVIGGLNLTKTVYNDLPIGFTSANEPSWVSGLHVGVFGQVKLSEKLSVVPELQFSQKGYEVTYSVTNVSSSVRINYLELPILLSYRIKAISVDLGPSISYRLSSTLADTYKDFDFGLAGGLRVYVTEKFFVTGRFYYGLAGISQITFFDFSLRTVGTVTEYNRAIQFGIGYKIK
jgi:hypothetical protein